MGRSMFEVFGTRLLGLLGIFRTLKLCGWFEIVGVGILDGLEFT